MYHTHGYPIDDALRRLHRAQRGVRSSKLRSRLAKIRIVGRLSGAHHRSG